MMLAVAGPRLLILQAELKISVTGNDLFQGRHR